MDNLNNTSKRKDEHIQIFLTNNVSYRKSNGFEKYQFIHDATTEVKIEEINLSTTFLGKEISFPIIISSMTGGTNRAGKLNEKLAKAAQKLNIAIGVGSQRASMESQKFINSYKVMREIAHSIPIMSNIGAAQIVKLKNFDLLRNIIDDIAADGLIIHLNPLQELIQKEGDTNFTGLLNRISEIKKKLPLPIIVKEVGSGINQTSARRLLDSGVDVIDVAGAGGTSWAAVELLRNPNSENDYFREWGLRTSYCIGEISKLKSEYQFKLVSSGGIENFVDITKSLALGADLVGSARSILKAVETDGVIGVIDLINSWVIGMKKIMFLTGSRTLEELKKEKIIRSEQLY